MLVAIGEVVLGVSMLDSDLLELFELTGVGACLVERDRSVFIGVRCCLCGGAGGCGGLGGGPSPLSVDIARLVSRDIIDMPSPLSDGIGSSSASKGMACTGPGGSAAKCGMSSMTIRTGFTFSASTEYSLSQTMSCHGSENKLRNCRFSSPWQVIVLYNCG